MYPELIRRYHQIYNNHPIVSKMDEPNQVGISIPYAECEYNAMGSGVAGNQSILVRLCDPKMKPYISKVEIRSVYNISKWYTINESELRNDMYYYIKEDSIINGESYPVKYCITFKPGTKDFSNCFQKIWNDLSGKPATGLTSIKFSYINCKDTISYEGMFQNQNLLTSINMSAVQTPHISSLKDFMEGCKNLTEWDVGTNILNITSKNKINYLLWSNNKPVNITIYNYSPAGNMWGNAVDFNPNYQVSNYPYKKNVTWIPTSVMFNSIVVPDNNYIEW